MAKSKKKIVQEFYKSDFFNDTSNLDKYMHPEMELYWNAKTGYNHMDIQAVKDMATEAGKSFDAVRPRNTFYISRNYYRDTRGRRAYCTLYGYMGT